MKEISYKVGFEDPLYFSRIFKKFMGKSPRNYKQSQRK
nr:AraC family transcriptional regulator [Polaribacter filamentus]